MGMYLNTEKIVSQGQLYLCGRDNKERPVLYIDLAKILQG